MTDEEKDVSSPVFIAVHNLCDGNPAAISTIFSLMANMAVLFPTAHVNKTPTYFAEIFNEYDFFGRDIFLLHKFICAEELGMTAAFALAMHHDILDPAGLRKACDLAYQGLHHEFSRKEELDDVLFVVRKHNKEFHYVRPSAEEIYAEV